MPLKKEYKETISLLIQDKNIAWVLGFMITKIILNVMKVRANK